jgi:hypothetical protein
MGLYANSTNQQILQNQQPEYIKVFYICSKFINHLHHATHACLASPKATHPIRCLFGLPEPFANVYKRLNTDKGDMGSLLFKLLII